MGTRLVEAWGGNRVYNGGAWMELYYALEIEYDDLSNVPLTPTGKVPNATSSVFARFLVSAVFDANTLDNSNTFRMRTGSSFPYYNGTVNIPNVSDVNVYNQRALVSTSFGESVSVRAICSLTGIERVPGTTSFDKTHHIPRRAWATPNVPTITGYSLNSGGTIATVGVSGHRRDTAQDRYWQNLDHRLYHSSTGWVESLGGSGGDTSRSFSDLVGNREYRVSFRTWNEDGGVSAWCTSQKVYTKPAAPVIGTVKRKTTDLTKVDISWTVAAAFPGRHYIERRMTPADSWAGLANVDASVSTYTDTVATGTQPQYRVRTISYDSKIYSDYSATGTSDIGSVKEFIPGVNEIYLGTTKITKVFTNNKEIWFSG